MVCSVISNHVLYQEKGIRELERLMDADSDAEPPMSSLGKGKNPYIVDTCLLCRCRRATSRETGTIYFELNAHYIHLTLCQNKHAF